MTFVEAAVEVLRIARKALPVDQLTRLAVERKLLSVVGRDPEQTMTERLTDAINRDVHHKSGIVQLRPGVFGLTAYPEGVPEVVATATTPAKVMSFAAAAQAVAAGAPAVAKTSVVDPAATSAANADEAPAKSGRSRGRRGGRGKGGAKEIAAAPVVAVAEKVAAKPSRRRRGGKAAKAETIEPAALAVAAAEPAALPEPPAAIDDAADFAPLGDEFDDLDATPSPAMMVSPGLEDVVRSGEEREKRAELRTSASRDRDRRHGRGGHKKGGDRGRPDARPSEPRPTEARASEARPNETRPSEARPNEARSRRGGRGRNKDPRHNEAAAGQPNRDQRPSGPELGDRGTPKDLWAAALEVLQQSGRLHVQKLADELIRRRLVDSKSSHAELTARLRTVLGKKRPSTATLGNARSIVALGGGNFCIAGAKLEPEIAQAEDQLKQRLHNLQDLTARALQMRIERLRAPMLESVTRLVTEALGLCGFELVRRTPDVAYFGGDRLVLGVSVRTLVAVWPTTTPLSRRAVGELRAGLSAKGYQQGWLFSPAALSADAMEEWKASPTVEPYVGERFVQLCITHKVGVRSVPVSVETIDPGFWSELND